MLNKILMISAVPIHLLASEDDPVCPYAPPAPSVVKCDKETSEGFQHAPYFMLGNTQDLIDSTEQTIKRLKVIIKLSNAMSVVAKQLLSCNMEHVRQLKIQEFEARGRVRAKTRKDKKDESK